MTLNPIGRIRVNVTGARGGLGIDLQGTPTPGQFLVKAPGSGRTFNTATGTGADAGLRTDLAAVSGSNNIGYRRANLGNGGATLSQQQKNDQRYDLRDHAGLDLTGNNDNKAILQDALNKSAAAGLTLYVPAGIIACAGSLQVPQGFSMQGMGRSKGVPATRFLFTSTDAGFLCGDGSDSSGYEDGFLFRDIVTSRMQPAPPSSGTWTPIDAQPDFVMNGSTDLDLEHVLFLNSTRAVNMLGGGGIGRLNMDNCGGQVFVYGVNVELAADTCKFTNIHWWPFWSDTLPVNNFSCANADHFYLKRCDSPQFVNVSSIAARSGFRFSANAQGATTNALITNAALDYATSNIWFDAACIGASAWINNLTTQANNSSGDLANIASTNPRINIEMQGTNDYLAINNSSYGGGSGPAVWIHGNAEECHLGGGIFVHSYGTASGDTSGCFVSIGNNKLILDSDPRVDTPGSGKLYDGNGYISSPSWRDYIPTITYSGSPTGGSYSGTGRYRVQGKSVSVEAVVNIASAPTGTLNELCISEPYSSESQGGSGYGSYFANAVEPVYARVQSAQARVLLTANKAPPTIIGSLRVHFEYTIA
jgi:hypothetical protein